MHWLSEQVRNIHKLSKEYEEYRTMPSEDHHGIDQVKRKARQDFFDALESLVADISMREGVDGCFASYKGLLVDSGGESDFEALAAMTEKLIDAGVTTCARRNMGGLKQMGVVGDGRKVALFWFSEIAVGIIGDAAVSLGSLLSRRQ